MTYQADKNFDPLEAKLLTYNVARNIRTWRTRTGLTQSDMVKEIMKTGYKLSLSTYQSYESENKAKGTNPPISFLVAFSIIVGRLTVPDGFKNDWQSCLLQIIDINTLPIPFIKAIRGISQETEIDENGNIAMEQDTNSTSNHQALDQENSTRVKMNQQIASLYQHMKEYAQQGDSE